MIKRIAAQILLLCILLNAVSEPVYAGGFPSAHSPAEETAASTPSDAEDPENAAEPEPDQNPDAEQVTVAETATPSEALGYLDLELEHESVGDTGLYGADLPASYDSRWYHSIPEVRNQGSYGTCWAHSVIAQAEGSIAVRKGTAEDYSEGALAYFTYHHVTDPLGLTDGDASVLYGADYRTIGGNADLAGLLLSGWVGAAAESDAPYSSFPDGYRDWVAYNSKAVLTDARYYNKADTALIKQAIMENGVIGLSYYSTDESYKRDSNGTWYYYPANHNSNHAVSVVGWDDSVSRYSFTNSYGTPSVDGAWLCRNSWGSNWGSGGYFWLSYGDATVSNFNSMTFIPKEEAWDHNYFYDGTLNPYSSAGIKNGQSVANVYRMQGSCEVLEAVSFVTRSANVAYSIQVYKKNGTMSSPLDGNAQLSSPVTGQTGAEGIYTVSLPKPVSLQAGDYFAVVITVTGAYAYFGADQSKTLYYGSYGSDTYVKFTNATEPGRSYVIQYGQNYDQHSQGKTVRIKAFTSDAWPVTYVLNGGKNSSGNPSAYSGSFSVDLLNPSRTGYTFAGWYTDPGMSGTPVTSIPAGSSGSLTFYAKWTANTYQVKFNGNGSTSGSMKAQRFSYGTPAALTANAFKKTGYDFTGWNTKKNGSGTTYANRAKVKNLRSSDGSSVTLYAQWKKSEPVYTITYVLNGGKNSGKNPSVYRKSSATITLQSPSRTGYTFGGWYANKNLTGNRITKITKGSTGNKTFYAKWTANTYTVKFNGNGSTSGSMSPLTGRKYGTSYTLPAARYSRTGYVFKGWNTRADGKGTSYKDRASVKNLTSKTGGSVTLYAQWSLPVYSITYVLNGGTNSKKNPSSYQKTTSTITLQAASKTGYTFAGWYTSRYFTAGSRVKKIVKGSTGSRTLYAKWTANTYSVKFNGNGSTSGSMKTLKGKVYGVKFTLTANSFAKKGYTFSGWNTKADGKGKSYTNKASVKNLSSKAGGSVTLYAQWKANTYTIRFSANGGTGSMAAVTAKYGKTVTLKACTMKKTGRFFSGWNTRADGKGTSYSDQAKVKNLTAKNGGTVTLYAQWGTKSGWVLASKVPKGAKITDRKWIYTKVETKISDTQLPGWTVIGENWQQTGSGSSSYASFPGGYSTSDGCYSRYAGKRISGFENTAQKRVITGESRTSYIYWHWTYTSGVLPNNNYNCFINDYSGWVDGRNYQYFTAFEDPADYGHTDPRGTTVYDVFYVWRGVPTDGSWWWYRIPVMTQYYTDYKKVWQLQKKTNNVVSKTKITPSAAAENVRQYVRYVF